MRNSFALLIAAVLVLAGCGGGSTSHLNPGTPCSEYLRADNDTRSDLIENVVNDAGTPGVSIDVRQADAACKRAGAQALIGRVVVRELHARAGDRESHRPQRTALASVSGTAESGQGDQVKVSFGIGEAVPVTSVSDPAGRACDSQLADFGSSADRSMAVPIDVTMTVTSPLDADVGISVGSVKEVADDGSVQLALVLWSAAYESEGPACGGPNTGTVRSTVHWPPDAATPGTTRRWRTWMIVPAAITPSDPSGVATTGRLVFGPNVAISNNVATFHPEASASLVSCSASDAALGQISYVAIDPAGATAHGCESVNNPAESESVGTAGPGEQTTSPPATSNPSSGQASAPPTPAQANDEGVCSSQYPAGTRVSRDVAFGYRTYWDRQGSVHEVVCNGFGIPEDLDLSPGMRCALIAAAATFGPPGQDLAANRLCDAASIVDALETGDWVQAAASQACGFLGEVFAGGVGALAAGATSVSGPGAVAVGVGTYKALSAGLKIACGGLIDGGAKALGVKLEADHDYHIAIDILRKGECLRMAERFGLIGWSAVDCDAAARVTG
jgi:hypothetical protein